MALTDVPLRTPGLLQYEPFCLFIIFMNLTMSLFIIIILPPPCDKPKTSSEFYDVQGSIHSQLTELSIFLVFRTNFPFASYQQFRKPKHLFR